jgi:NADH-quinone oxidoreductase subunit F
MTRRVNGDGVTLRLPASMASPSVPASVQVRRVGPTGVGRIDPVVTVTEGGETTIHTQCDPTDVEEVLAAIETDGLPAAAADAIVEHDPETAAFPTARLTGLNDRHVLAGCGWRRPTEPDDHTMAGGFVDIEQSDLREVAIRGRGWGDWCRDEPLDGVWETARTAEESPIIVVNAHGSTADALLLESVPFEVLEGANAAAIALEADGVIVYASGDDEQALERAREAAAAYPEPAAPIDVIDGPPVYRAAEPTMALEAIEGNHRLEARLRPPGPEEVGLHGRPTLVHSARTLAHLALGVRGAASETRLVTVTGDVEATATVELPESATLDRALAAAEREEYKAACVGGQFGGLTDTLDITATPDRLRAAGLGTEGTVEVLGEDRCVVRFVSERAQFAANTNCGRCVPCREGTTQLANLLADVSDGDYQPAKLQELQRVMERTSICTFGVDAGRPTRTAIETFEREFEAHADGQCPTGGCRPVVNP